MAYYQIKNFVTELYLTIILIFFSFSHFLFNALIISCSLLFFYFIFSLSQFKKVKVKKRHVIKFMLLFSFFNCFLLLSLFFEDFYLNNYIRFLCIQFFLIIFVFISQTSITVAQLENSLKFYLYFQVIIFFIQFFTYLIFNYYINFDEMIRGDESYALYQTQSLSDSFISIRATGLYPEPSFYSMFVLIPVGYFFAKNKLNLAVILAIFTALLSFSMVSVLCCLLMLAVFFFSNKYYKTMKFLIVFFILLILPTIYSVYQLRINESVDYDAIASRLIIFTELESRNIIYDIIGSGFFWDARQLIGQSQMLSYHITDSSTYIYIYYCGGLIGVFLLFLLLRQLFLFNKKGVCYLLIIMLFKFQILIGFFWLAIFLIGFKSKENS